MPLTTTITPDDIAVALGVAVPQEGSAKHKQWAMWIESALLLVQIRADSVEPSPAVDQARLNYVIREAVAAQARHPDDATSVSVAVDDANVSRRYSSGTGRVTIRDEWWDMLGLITDGGRAFAVDTAPSSSLHLPWCSLRMGAEFCSCGTDIAGYPIYGLP